jgi:Uma2 family endonuclease
MVVTPIMTAEAIERMGTKGERLELVNGVITEKEPMGARHGETEIRLILPLGLHVLGKGLGEIYPSDTQFKIQLDPEIIHIPDIAFVRADRLPPREARTGPLPLAPDLAVEVISPNDRYVEVMEKVERYLRAGVGLVWLVDPWRRAVEVHALGRPPRVLRESDTLDGGEVLPGFTLAVAEIFQ